EGSMVAGKNENSLFTINLDQVKIYSEQAIFNFPGDHTAFYPQEESLFSHNERRYIALHMKDIGESAIASLPAVVDVGGVKVAIAESDIEDYPGLWLHGTGGNALAAMFPPYPLREKLERDRDL